MEVVLSSAKRGYGLRELLCPSDSEYWATNDALPHSIHIRFTRRTYVHAVCLRLDIATDESYTPERVALFADGRMREFSLAEPAGLVEFPLGAAVFEVRVIILANNSDGKDSHVRGLVVRTGPAVAHGEEMAAFRY